MYMTLTPMLLVTLVATVTPLCTPDQWEGMQHGLAAYVSGDKAHKGFATETMDIHYDAVNNRTALVARFQGNGKTTHAHVVSRHNNDGTDNGVQYVVDKDTGKCTKNDFHGPFLKFCIPAGSFSEGSTYMGPEGVFKVNRYVHPKKGHIMHYLVYMVGDSSYVPVETIAHGHFGNYSGTESLIFNNINTGIKDESVFDVPAECQSHESFETAVSTLKYFFSNLLHERVHKTAIHNFQQAHKSADNSFKYVSNMQMGFGFH